MNTEWFLIGIASGIGGGSAFLAVGLYAAGKYVRKNPQVIIKPIMRKMMASSANNSGRN